MQERLQACEEVAPRLVGLQVRAPFLPICVVLVAPDRRIGGERADVGREDADQVAEMPLLQLDALGLVHAYDLVQLAGEDVVVTLLDDHSSIPPMQRYFNSSHSSIPYFEPSRPMPDSLTPPNGATSVEMTPVLMPTMPY